MRIVIIREGPWFHAEPESGHEMPIVTAHGETQPLNTFKFDTRFHCAYFIRTKLDPNIEIVGYHNNMGPVKKPFNKRNKY